MCRPLKKKGKCILSSDLQQFMFVFCAYFEPSSRLDRLINRATVRVALLTRFVFVDLDTRDVLRSSRIFVIFKTASFSLHEVRVPRPTKLNSMACPSVGDGGKAITKPHSLNYAKCYLRH